MAKTEEQKLKQKWLMRYRGYKRQADSLFKVIEEWHATEERPDAPQTAIETIKLRLAEEIYTCLAAVRSILEAGGKSDLTPLEREVFARRYLEGAAMVDIAREAYYSVQHVNRANGSLLNKIVLPDGWEERVK